MSAGERCEEIEESAFVDGWVEINSSARAFPSSIIVQNPCR